MHVCIKSTVPKCTVNSAFPCLSSQKNIDGYIGQFGWNSEITFDRDL